jgi:hypothetical protein
MRTFLALALLLLTLAPGLAAAAELRGQDDPRFRAAIALWLDDDDETALPEVAALAAQGNRAAQVLLAQIDITPWFQGPWLVGLPREERNALLRAPGGLSGRSWMQVAAEDTPLARLWLIQHLPNTTAETALAFAAMGESAAARQTLFALSRRDYHGFAAKADDPNYPPDMRYLIWREWTEDPATRTRAEAEITAIHPGDPQLTHFDSRPIDPGVFNDWLADAALVAPRRALCEAACPDSVRSCTRATYQLSVGTAVFISGHDGLLLAGSPSDSLIAPEVWDASPRGRAAILRHPDSRSAGAEATLATVAAEDACFAAVVRNEVARFRPAAR